jgi:hypothetical protein
MTEAAVSFAGNLTDQPEVRHTEGGIARAMFRVAVSGRRDQEPSFFTVVVWRDQAEHVAESLVMEAGRLSRSVGHGGCDVDMSATDRTVQQAGVSSVAVVAGCGVESSELAVGGLQPSGEVGDLLSELLVASHGHVESALQGLDAGGVRPGPGGRWPALLKLVDGLDEIALGVEPGARDPRRPGDPGNDGALSALAGRRDRLLGEPAGVLAALLAALMGRLDQEAGVVSPWHPGPPPCRPRRSARVLRVPARG